MNKDIIYIEPEDDITDILDKLKKSSQKVVALVPPKKVGVLRSAVNMKLIAKTAKTAGKAAVVVTADPSLVKMAATARIPIAKTLQSRPEIPTAEMVAASMAAEQVIEDDLSDKEEKPAGKGEDNRGAEKVQKEAKKPEKPADMEMNDEENKDKKKKGKDKNKKNIPAIEKYRKWIIIGAVALVILIGVLIWAFAIAPSAKITVKVKAAGNDFSENVSLGLKNTDEMAKEGKFVLEENKYETQSSTNFTATGKKDVGEKASGTLTIYAYFRGAETISIPAGTSFAYNGNQYVSTGGATLSWDEKSECENRDDDIKEIAVRGCLQSSSIAIAAAQSGEKYNTGAHPDGGWTAGVNGVFAYNSNAISGGTTKNITVVTQADVDKAKGSLTDSSDSEGKAELMKQIKDGKITIESSYSRAAGDVVASPGVGEEVKDGVTPTLKAVTVYKIFTVDKAKVDEYIKGKTTTTEDQEIYSTGKPYFERFSDVGGGNYSARLKTSVYIGPKITEEDILNQAKGKKVGEVQSRLKSITGVSDVEIKTSFFWVGSIPNDSNKVQIEKIVEDQENQNK